MPIDETFLIKCGIGTYDVHSNATFSIEAPGFEITAPDGTTNTDIITVKYTDFNLKKYKPTREDGNIAIKYFENFTFRYICYDLEDEITGSIRFEIRTADERTDKTSLMGKANRENLKIYYTIEDGKIDLSVKEPK